MGVYVYLPYVWLQGPPTWTHCRWLHALMHVQVIYMYIRIRESFTH